MRPIQNIETLHPGAVLYHSAFGFARVTGVEAQRVQVSWEASPENLPTTVSQDVLTRVYAHCVVGGFFYRTLDDHQAMTQAVKHHPLDSLASLLGDLPEPQPGPAIIDWLVRRRLLGLDSAQRWWKALLAAVPHDPRFAWAGDCIHLAEPCGWEDALRALATDDLPAHDRLALTLQYRPRLGVVRYQAHLCRAWVEGGGPLDERALEGAMDLDPTDLIQCLMRLPGSDHALACYLQQGPADVQQVPADLHARLRARMDSSSTDPLDEGRLAFALVRWRCPGAASLMVERATRPATQARIRSACQNLNYEVAADFLTEMIDTALQDGCSPVAQWLGGEYLRLTLQMASQASASLHVTHPRIAAWFQEEFEDHHGAASGDSAHEPTEEIEASSHVPESTDSESQPLTHAHLGAGSVLLEVAAAIAQGLLQIPPENRPRSIATEHVWVDPEGSIDLRLPALSTSNRRSQGKELSSIARLLLHSLTGQPLPLDPPPWKMLPGLHSLRADLPPSGMAPLTAALHPAHPHRPSLETWHTQVQASMQAEKSRTAPKSSVVNASLEVGFDSHIGRAKLLSSQVNEDALFVDASGPTAFVVLCDGISTCTAGRGDLASNRVCQVFSDAWRRDRSQILEQPDSRVFSWFEQITKQANDAVCREALLHAGGNLHGRIPMGTTLVALLVHAGHVYLASAGDSRAYLVGPYGASLLTSDDNQATERMLQWAAEGWPRWRAQGPALTRYVGCFDVYDRPVTPQLRVRDFRLAPGEQVLVCSDGITQYLAPNEPEVARQLGQVLTAAHDAHEAASALVQLANHAGGRDNASCAVLRMSKPSAGQPTGQ